MRMLILGAGGMIGRKTIARLARDGVLGDAPITHLRAHDLVAPTLPQASFPMTAEAGDIAAPDAMPLLVADRPDVILHLAAIVSGEAEADFDLGYRVNLDATRALLEAVRQLPDYRPRLVFASSIAVFGAPFPDPIPETFHLTPLTSYGTQKAIAELLINDYSRRGFVEGIVLRLPTICVRPGAPNRAASGFFSSIIREPLAGREAVLPVGDDVMHWHASPRAAVGFLLHAATMDLAPVGPRRCLTMPGVAVTVGEQLAALAALAGPAILRLIRREPDPAIARMVAGWPRRFDARRAQELGFVAEASFEAIIRQHIDDELGGVIPR